MTHQTTERVLRQNYSQQQLQDKRRLYTSAYGHVMKTVSAQSDEKSGCHHCCCWIRRQILRSLTLCSPNDLCSQEND